MFLLFGEDVLRHTVVQHTSKSQNFSFTTVIKKILQLPFCPQQRCTRSKRHMQESTSCGLDGRPLIHPHIRVFIRVLHFDFLIRKSVLCCVLKLQC